MSGTVGFLDYALDEHALMSTLDVASTLESFNKSDLEAFLAENPDMSHPIACFQDILLCVAQIKDNSLFTAEMRNARLQSLADTYLTRDGPRDITMLLSEKVIKGFSLTLQKSVAVPEARFPPWLVYPLSQEVEAILRKRVSSFLVDRKMSGVGPGEKGAFLASPRAFSRQHRVPSGPILAVDVLAGNPTSGSPRSSSRLSSSGTTPLSARGGSARRFKFGGAKQLSEQSLIMVPSEESDPSQGFVRRSRRAATGSDYNLKSYLETSGELSADSELLRDQMSVRATTLNTSSSRTKFLDVDCVLDEANLCIFLIGRISAEIEVLQCALGVDSKQSFALTSAGFKYDFRGPEAVVQRWVDTLSKMQKKEETLARERVEKRNKILSLDPSSLPVSMHFRTFAPEVRPTEQHHVLSSSSGVSSDAEEVDEDADSPDMPWSQPNVHLAINHDDDSEGEGGADGANQGEDELSSSDVGRRLAEQDVMAAISSNYGITPAQMRKQSYGSGGEDFSMSTSFSNMGGGYNSPIPGALSRGNSAGKGPSTFNMGSYGAPPIIQKEGSFNKGTALIGGYGMSLGSIPSATPGMIQQKQQQLQQKHEEVAVQQSDANPSTDENSASGPAGGIEVKPAEVSLEPVAPPSPQIGAHAYHQTVPFQYHSVTSSPGTERVGTKNDSAMLKNSNRMALDLDEVDESGSFSSVDDEELLLSPHGGAHVRKKSHLEEIDRVIRREEQIVSKKLHRAMPSPAPSINVSSMDQASSESDSPAVPQSNADLLRTPVKDFLSDTRQFRDSGYFDVVTSAGSEQLSPRSLAQMTEGKHAHEESASRDSSDEDLDPSTTEDSQWERARDKYGDFNERFQRLVDVMREVDEDHRVYDRILGMTEDFFESAKRYARIVMDEAFLDPSKRTIAAVAPNVYVVGHIVLELCSGKDVRFPEHMSYEMSAKSMGHQMKSFSALEDVQSTFFSLPLLAIIDFRGLRCTAYCKLPISQKTLLYGPLDGHFYDKDARVLSELKRCTKQLNLKPSFCGLNRKRARVVGGYGMQVHRAPDKRFYVTQAGDLYPCVRPNETPGRKRDKGSEFVELFRPEFVQCYPVPLSPNAYKTWATGMPDEEDNRAEIDEATRLLETTLVPTFAKDLTELVRERGAFASGERNILRANELMHEYGLNVRYLGMVLAQMTIGNPAHMLLLVEMVARVIKIELRSQMRQKAADVKIVCNEPHKALVAAMFDLVFASSSMSQNFWNGFIINRLESKFSVSAESWSDFPSDLRRHIVGNDTARLNLFTLMCKMVGVTFEDQQRQLVKRYRGQLRSIFTYESVKELVPIVRQLDFVAEARGWLYQSRAAEHESRGFFSSAQHFYSASVDAYKAALSRSPINSTILRQLGEVVFKVARLESALIQGKRNLATVQLDPDNVNLRQARSCFVRAIKVDPDPMNYQAYAHFLENLGLNDHAEALYLQALLVNPNHVYILVRYGQFLSHTRQLYEIADLFFSRAKEVTNAAVELAGGQVAAKKKRDRSLEILDH